MKRFFRKVRHGDKGAITVLVGFIAIILLIIAIVVVVVIKNSKKVEVKPEPKKEVKKVEKPVTIVDLNSKSRPYAVMINNINEARQVQSGLTEAYMVYELLAEGGITRYLALFKDKETEKIGSVRSARHYYIDYVLENDAIYVHFGYSTQAQYELDSLGIANNINFLYDNGYWRDNPFGIASEHTAFTSMANIKEVANKKGYRQETDKGVLLNYDAEGVDLTKYESATDANKITIVYSNYTTDVYDYDAENKVYIRSVNGSVQRDFAADKDITAKNIIYYTVDYSSIPGDEKNRLNVDNIGTGEGYYISEGKAIKITWTKDKRDSKTIYKDEKGNELKVNDGNTFIQIVPKTGSITVE